MPCRPTELLVAVDSEQRFWLYPVDGGPPRLLRSLKAAEDPIRWSADSQHLFVASGSVPADVDRIEVATGRRDLLYRLAPADAAGVWNVWPVLVTPDASPMFIRIIGFFPTCMLPVD